MVGRLSAGHRIAPARYLLMLVCVGFAAALSLAGCGGGDTNRNKSTASDSERDDIRIEFAMVGVPGDPFYTVIKNGARQAGADMGVEVQYNETTQYDFQEQVRLIKSTAAKEPDAMIVSDESPDVLDPVIKETVDSGIPVMIVNVIGERTLEETGALGFVGQDEVKVGRKVAENLKAEGVARPLCLNPAPGAAFSVARIDGLRSVYGDALSCIAADQTNRTAAVNAIEAALQQRDDVDALVGLSVTTDEPALQAVENTDAQDEIKVAGIDLSPTVLEAIDEGRMLFTSDQQQYLQGYLPVVMLALHEQYGFGPPPFTETGPALITSENAADVRELSKQGIR